MTDFAHGPDVPPANPQRPVLQTPPVHGIPPPPEYIMAVPAQSDRASWATRVRARLIDQFPTYLGLIIFCVGYLIFIVQLASSGGSTSQLAKPAVVMIIGLGAMLVSLGWVAYNRWHLAGKTGQSVGKRVSKIRLIGEETYAPIGAKNAFIRDVVHILDALTLVGYLWPLWDDKRQTFADQVMKTVVIDEAGSHRQ
ncbi:MAG TPA: RDD family protein [Propionibacteriaceae bacterium]